MAKRTRYPARTTARPGGNRAVPKGAARPATKPANVPPRAADLEALEAAESALDEMPEASAGHLTEAELARTEAIQEAALKAQAGRERAAIAESLRRAETRHRGAPEDVNAPLSVRMAHEYAYVARDVRRIIVTASVMFGILAVLFVLQMSGVLAI
jgi:hypothetical protein